VVTTFRDFAGAIMKGDVPAAASVLEELLGLSAVRAHTASESFRAAMATGGPQFMQQAMGLRGAVTTGTDAEIAALLVACFGLAQTECAAAVAVLRQRYPLPSA